MTVEVVAVKNSHTRVLQVVNVKSQRKVFFFLLFLSNKHNTTVTSFKTLRCTNHSTNHKLRNSKQITFTHPNKKNLKS